MSDDDDYSIPLKAPSSVIMLILCISSACSTLYVVINVIRVGFKTSSSKLVLYLNLTITLWTIATLPYVYTEDVCDIFGFVFSYAVYQSILITYFMLKKTNVLRLIDNTEVTETTEMVLEARIVWIILLVPLIPATISVLGNSFEKRFNWCQLDRQSQSGFYIYVVSLVLVWIVELATIWEIGVIMQRLWDLPRLVFIDMSAQILCGPAAYALFTTGVFLLVDVVIIYDLYRKGGSSGQEKYYIAYAYHILQYLLGIGYAVIFLHDRKSLEAFEQYYNDLQEFEQEFGGSAGSAGSSYRCSVPASEGSLSVRTTPLTDKLLSDDTI
mmetsp:Transcript_21541/g.31299  ORF Transcript_21541/g.31299 Transcript_21541/m.31299 type:complete len:326 (+) Transcript_21541:99-1076(+)